MRNHSGLCFKKKKKRDNKKNLLFLLFIGFVLGDNPFSVWQTENYFFN